MNLNEAKETLTGWMGKVVWKRSFGRPFRTQEIQIEALLATWEALDGVHVGRDDASRCRELRRRCKELSSDLARMNGMPVMARSFEHRVSLEHARWSLSVLTLALDLWSAKLALGKERKRRKTKKLQVRDKNLTPGSE